MKFEDKEAPTLEYWFIVHLVNFLSVFRLLHTAQDNQFKENSTQKENWVEDIKNAQNEEDNS